MRETIYLVLSFVFNFNIYAQEAKIDYSHILGEIVSNDYRHVLVAEQHFIAEKHEVLAELALEMHKAYPEDTLNVVLELPRSLGYLLDQLVFKGDSARFSEYFNHLYIKKRAPSLFWLDFKELVLKLTDEIPENKLRFHCIDMERKYRRTAYCLKEFIQATQIDEPIELLSVLDSETVVDSDSLRNILLEVISDYKDVDTTNYLNEVAETLCITEPFGQRRNTKMSNLYCKIREDHRMTLANFGLSHVLDTAKIIKMMEPPRQSLVENGKLYNPSVFQICQSKKKDTYVIGLITLHRISRKFGFKRAVNREYLFNQETVTLFKQLTNEVYFVQFESSRFPLLEYLPFNYFLLFESNNFRGF